jgi:integrase-like protein
LRFHDLRHHAITELVESEASDQTIMAIAGHVSPKMLAHYSHIRLEAKRKALNALSKKPNATFTDALEPGYVTHHATNGELSGLSEAEEIEKNGRHVGTRTPDLYRVNLDFKPLQPFGSVAFPFFQKPEKQP